MKKNITINLCGRLFNIDEDAYELLRNYMDTLRSYFARQEGGEEIADDIEQRIAELLEELKSQGVEAINIDHVKQVINRVGQPEEMDEASPEPNFNQSLKGMENAEETGDKTESGETNERPKFSDFMDQLKDLIRERRFYRNPKDKMLAGVISGLASSFEIDVTLLRLLLVAVAILLGAFPFPFLHGWHLNISTLLFFVLVYAIMAVIMPEAETPEQQLKMQGKPVNMQNLAEEVVQNVTEKADNVKQSSGTKGFLNSILRFFASCFKVIMVLLAVALFFGGVALLLMAVFAIYSPDSMSDFFAWHMEPILGRHLKLFVTFLIAILATMLIPAYAIIQHLVHPLKISQRLFLLFTWIAALATAVVTGAMLDQVSWKYRNQQMELENVNMNKETVTDEGVSMKLWEYDFLSTHGWTILNGEGCNNRFTAQGEYYLNNRPSARYLDCYDEHHRQRYHAERSDTLMPGSYKLTCAVRANGRGAFVYTLIGGKKTLQEIPATGNTGGGIWQEAVDSLNHVSAIPSSGDEEIARKPAVEYFEEIARANGGKGFGWNHLVFEPIIIKEPHTIVNYGVTTDPDFTGQSWLGQWFSACDFIIEREGD